jgi:hypothetical protein
VILLAMLTLVVSVLLFLAVEGFASTYLIARKISKGKPIAETLHTGYDELLGWSNLSDLYISDMYGPGIYLETNGQGFRNSQDFSQAVPQDKVRLICSGDSFTLGYGVDNEHTWCQLLVAVDPRLETVNMGQGGYGVDQAYLWYARDGTKLAQDIHIFAFITRDFLRMQEDEFYGYRKPLLRVEDGVLTTSSSPVAPPSRYTVWYNRNRSTISQLSSMKLLNLLFFAQDPILTSTSLMDQGSAREITARIFQDLDRINRAQGSMLVLVYLPTQGDYDQGGSDSWRTFVRSEAEKSGLNYVDLVDEIRTLPADSIEALFIGAQEVEFQGAVGHYTEQGNAYIARVLYQRLSELPDAAARLAR